MKILSHSAIKNKNCTMSELVTTELKEGRCHACGCVGPNPGVEISPEEVRTEFSKLRPGFWNLDSDQKELSREFVCRNFMAAIDFMNKAAEIAERKDINHHPDFHLTGYRNIKVVLKTHSVMALTNADFALAKALEEIPFDYSPKWLKENKHLGI